MEEYRPDFSEINVKNLKLPVKRTLNIPLVIVLSLLIFVTVSFTAFVAYVFFFANVFPGVSFNGIRLGGMSREEVHTFLNDWSQDVMDQDVVFQYGDVSVSSKISELVEDYDVSGTMDSIYGVGHEGDIIRRGRAVVSAMLNGYDVPPVYTVNQLAVDELVAAFTKKVKCAAKPAGYDIRGDVLEVYSGLQGVDVDPDEIREMLLNRLANPDNMPLTPELAITQLPVDVDAIYDEVRSEMKNAYVEPGGMDGYTIVPEVVGRDFDVSVLRSQLKAGSGDTIRIPLVVTQPEITADKLKSILFADLLSSKRTTLDPGLVNRTTNVRLASEKINMILLFPGESFSYNDVVGERTVENGFKEAKIYVQNEIVDGVGGGICQVSSTLYSAVLHANLQVDNRRSHRFTVAYISLGEDATVYWRSVDFNFTNNSEYPILIKSQQKSNYLDVEIWGTKTELNEYDIEIVNNTVKSTPFSTVTKVDPALKTGESKVTQKGSNGYTVETYKVYKKNGTEIKRDFISKSVYYPANQIVMVGPEPETPPTTTTTTTTTTDPSTDPTADPSADPGTGGDGEQDTDAENGGQTGNTPAGSETEDE